MQMSTRQSVAQHAANVADSFACVFARRTCPHSTMFLDAYQRTNRTRGTKILRCFPHCCPHHVARSYCGGPVYLQVDLLVDNVGPIDDASLCVFAHFHPRTMPGLARGQFVARSMFRDNQQTDTNATGEWIGARLMASADHTTWMFEVNPSGRWYYQWESGATKAQRATKHVLEAYVLVVDPVLDRCEVVATSMSGEFQMISFRRAPAGDTKAGSTDEAVDSPAPHRPSILDTETQITAEEEEKEGDPLLVVPWQHRDSMDSALSSDAEMASQLQSLMPSQSNSPTSSPHVTMDRLQQPQRPPPEPTSSASPQDGPMQDPVDASPLSLLPATQITRFSHELGSLLDFVQALPSSALELVTSEIRGVVLAPRLGGHSLSVSSLIAGPPSPHGSTNAAFPPALAAVVLRVALWLLFNREWTHTQEEYLQHASTDLLDKAALYSSYFAWLEKIQHDIQAFLSTTRTTATLSTLARDARLWLSRSTATVCPPDVGCRGLESFVAQAREVFLTGDDLGRTRRRRSTATPPANGTQDLPGDLRLFSAVWFVDAGSIQWHSGASCSSPSAFILLWAWRQALGQELAIDEDTVSPPALSVASLWNPSWSSPDTTTRSARLVLDGKPRWLRVFPSGESTSSVALGRQRLGHYVASFRRETRELLVNLYTWPRLLPTLEACCYCLRWCLRLETGDELLDVRVAVERGQLRRDADIVALDERSLTYKLQAVESWTTVASLQYAYHRHRR